VQNADAPGAGEPAPGEPAGGDVDIPPPADDVVVGDSICALDPPQAAAINATSTIASIRLIITRFSSAIPAAPGAWMRCVPSDPPRVVNLVSRKTATDAACNTNETNRPALDVAN